MGLSECSQVSRRYLLEFFERFMMGENEGTAEEKATRKASIASPIAGEATKPELAASCDMRVDSVYHNNNSLSKKNKLSIAVSGASTGFNDCMDDASADEKGDRPFGRWTSNHLPILISLIALGVSILTGIIIPTYTASATLAFGGPDSKVIELANRNGIIIPLVAIKMWNCGNSTASDIQVSNSNANVYFLLEDDSGDVRLLTNNLYLDAGASATILFYAPEEYLSGTLPNSYESPSGDDAKTFRLTISYKNGSPADMVTNQIDELEVVRDNDNAIAELRRRQLAQAEDVELLNPVYDISAITPSKLSVNRESREFSRSEPDYYIPGMKFPQAIEP